MTDNKISIPNNLKDVINRYKSVSADDMQTSSYPRLKVISKNSKAELLDGSKPNDGTFFLTNTQKSYKTLDIRVLTSVGGYFPKLSESRKINAKYPNLSPEELKKKLLNSILDFNKDNFSENFSYSEVLSGVVINDTKPFIMFLSGHKLQNFWELRGRLSVTANENGILPYMLDVKLSSTVKETTYGDTYIVNFDIVIDKNNIPKLSITANEAETIGSNIDVVKTFLKTYRDKFGYKSARQAEDVWRESHMADSETVIDDTVTDEKKIDPSKPSEIVNYDDIPF